MATHKDSYKTVSHAFAKLSSEEIIKDIDRTQHALVQIIAHRGTIVPDLTSLPATRAVKSYIPDRNCYLPIREDHGGPALLTKRRTPRVKATTLARYVSPKVPPAASLISSCAILIFI